MKQSWFTRFFSSIASGIQNYFKADSSIEVSAKEDSNAPLIREILTDPSKEQAVLQYLASKERFEGSYYNIDAKDFVEGPGGEPDDYALDKATRERELLLDVHESDIREKSDALEALGLNPYSIDDLKLTSEEFRELASSVRPDAARPNGLRLLPILKIHDTEFYVDLEKLEFRQVDNAKNAISFRDVHDNWTYTSVLYDPKTKNVFRGSEEEISLRPDVVLVQLPARTQLDPQYVADRVVENLKGEYMEARRKREVEDNSTDQRRQKQSDKKRGKGI